MDVFTWADIIKHGRHRSTPEVISRIEACCPHLECRETDEMYWRTLVDTTFPRRKLPVSPSKTHNPMKHQRCCESEYKYDLS